MTSRLLTCSLEQYRLDQVADVPTLNSHIAHEIITKSPLHAQMLHPKMGGISKDPNKAMDRGTLIHACLLHAGRAPVKIIEADNYRTKKAQEERDMARLAGELPMLEKDAEEIMNAAMILERKLRDDHGIVFNGRSEVPILWEQDGVLCRRCIDHLKPLDILELKTTASANPDFCARQCVNLGYDIAAAASIEAMNALEPDNAGRFRFRFVFVEPEPPFDVLVVPPSGSMLTLGSFRWSRALSMWKECLATGVWPGYISPLQLEPPSWALHEVLEEL